MSSPYLSTAEAARTLGVGVSTVKRWVDEGILPAHRTGGGHRKLLRSEVLALSREEKLPTADPALLLVDAAEVKSRGPEAIRPALLEAILTGEARQVRALLRRAYRSGMPLETLADFVIAPVLQQVGHDWEHGAIDVWQEHRGTQLCSAALYELFAEVAPRAERERPVAIGAGPEGDPYHLALLLAEMSLIDAGWQAVNLGGNTPFDSLTKALLELRPRLVWISASHLAEPERFVREYRAFQQQTSRLGVPIAIGGQALAEPVRSRLVYTTFGDGLTQLIQFARTLHPRARRPRRGRPRKT